jgi:hypothetical protein
MLSARATLPGTDLSLETEAMKVEAYCNPPALPSNDEPAQPVANAPAVAELNEPRASEEDGCQIGTSGRALVPWQLMLFVALVLRQQRRRA